MFVCSNPFAIKCYRAMTFSIYFLLIYFNAQTMLRVTIKLMMFLIELVEEHWYNMTQYFPGFSLVFLLSFFILSIVLAFPFSQLIPFQFGASKQELLVHWYILKMGQSYSVCIECISAFNRYLMLPQWNQLFLLLIFYFFCSFFVESNPHNRLWNSDMYYSSTVWIFKKGLTRNINI